VIRPSQSLYAGAALLLLASAALNACQHRVNGELREEVGRLSAALATARAANTSQAAALSELEKANREWSRECRVSDELHAQAALAAEFRSRADALSRELAKVKSHAPPSCQTLLETDIGAVCGPVTDLLRQHAGR
jgi:chromosome segregation ATPase